MFTVPLLPESGPDVSLKLTGTPTNVTVPDVILDTRSRPGSTNNFPERDEVRLELIGGTTSIHLLRYCPPLILTSPDSGAKLSTSLGRICAAAGLVSIRDKLTEPPGGAGFEGVPVLPFGTDEEVEILTGAAHFNVANDDTGAVATGPVMPGGLKVIAIESVPALAADTLNVASPFESVVAVVDCPASGPLITANAIV